MMNDGMVRDEPERNARACDQEEEESVRPMMEQLLDTSFSMLVLFSQRN